MNSGSDSKIQGTQSGKSASYKRAHRAKRPVLVTQQENAPVEEALAEEETPAAQVAVEDKPAPIETPERKRGPRFFSNVGKAESATDQPKADPAVVRMARAMRGKVTDAPPKEKAKETKAAPAPAKSSSAPARPRSGFKMRYIWGMMAYLLIADFLGIWITNFMVANHLDRNLGQIGPFKANLSTIVFLALLIIILVVMAKFDLIPRSLGAAMNSSSPAQRRGAPASSAKKPTFEAGAQQPTMKQGVKGAHDDLYREYRENQRYFQKRDRKR